MPSIRQLIQTSPAKANELFTKLVETSGNAVKTRERLFSELKEELELQMKLEEQHLFPVLRKRKETKDLVPDALNDNKETRKALAELERTPKESQEFASKVAELPRLDVLVFAPEMLVRPQRAPGAGMTEGKPSCPITRRSYRTRAARDTRGALAVPEGA